MRIVRSRLTRCGDILSFCWYMRWCFYCPCKKYQQMALTDILCRNASSLSKPMKLSDAGGLFLLVQPSGGKLSRLAYRFDGKQETLSLGKYPVVGLKEARRRRDFAKEQLPQVNRAGFAGGVLVYVARRWPVLPAWRSSVPRLRPAGYCRWVPAAGDC